MKEEAEIMSRKEYRGKEKDREDATNQWASRKRTWNHPLILNGVQDERKYIPVVSTPSYIDSTMKMTYVECSNI